MHELQPTPSTFKQQDPGADGLPPVPSGSDEQASQVPGANADGNSQHVGPDAKVNVAAKDAAHSHSAHEGVRANGAGGGLTLEAEHSAAARDAPNGSGQGQHPGQAATQSEAGGAWQQLPTCITDVWAFKRAQVCYACSGPVS